MPRPLFLTRRRFPKSLPHPLSKDNLFCSKPGILGAKSWEYFNPIERARIVVEKLCIKRGVRPPGFRKEYCAIVGCIQWFTEWEQSILCEENLWVVHCKFADFLKHLRRTQLPEDIDLLVDREQKTFHLVLEGIREYPLLSAKLKFCSVDNVRIVQQLSTGGETTSGCTTHCSDPGSDVDSVCSSCYSKP